MHCVRGSVVLVGLMTLGTESVAVNSRFEAVGIVTVRAIDTCLLHPALQDRTVDIDLAVNLPVGLIKT